MRNIYNSVLLFYTIIKIFSFRRVEKLTLIDFDFTLVNYNFKSSDKINLQNAIINNKIVELCNSYQKLGYESVLFTARGLRSKNSVITFLKTQNINYKYNLFLGSTNNKFKFLKFMLKFTKIQIILIDDLSDYIDRNRTFIKYKLDQDFFKNIDRLKYIDPNKYENS
jgi:hypothetical protein